MVARTPLDRIHPFDPRVLEDPGELDRRLRREAPVHRDPNTGIFLVSTYDAVVRALEAHELFSNRFGQALAGAARTPPEVQEIQAAGYPPVDTMLTADPPEQRRYRKLVNRAFVPRRVDALEARIESLSHELIDGFAADGRVEILSQYSQLLPLVLIAEQLGVPRADLPMFRRWSDGFVAQLGQTADRTGQVEAAKLIVEFQRYFAKRLEERRHEPRDDILSEIVHAQVEDERPLDVAECLSILQQLLVAGNETSANAIAEGMLLLLRNPDELARVQAEPGLEPRLVEEVLRLASPVANMWRICTRDAELCGVEIPKGSFLLLRFASANRDEARFPEPDRFDVARENAGEHLAFGHGIHFCLGAALARKEMEIAFRTLLERVGDWRLDPQHPPPRHKPHILLRGLEALYLRGYTRSQEPSG